MDLLHSVKMALLCMQRHSWEQGVAAQAFLEQGDMDIVALLCKEGIYRGLEDGRLAMLSPDMGNVTDTCSFGEPLLRSYEYTHDEIFKNALLNLEKWAMERAPRNAEGGVYHLNRNQTFWVDSFYMLPPFLAVMGHYDDALKQMDIYWKTLHSEEKGLLSHLWDDEKKEFVRKAFWGVGNGWAASGITRVLRMLPDAMKTEKELWSVRLKSLVDSCLVYQCENSLFHDVLDDPSTFVDTNFAQQLAYTLYCGIADGRFGGEYRTIADKMRAAALSKVDRYGLVQDACGAPHFDKAGVAPEAQSFTLLMEAAYAKLNQ